MKLIREELTNTDFLVEDDKNGKKNYFIEGIFMQSNIKNRNGRRYPLDVMEKEVRRYDKENIKKNRAFGELGHPDGPTINLERVSHMITNLEMDGENVKGKAKIMDTPYGKIVKNLMDEGATWAYLLEEWVPLNKGKMVLQKCKVIFILQLLPIS